MSFVPGDRIVIKAAEPPYITNGHGPFPVYGEILASVGAVYLLKRDDGREGSWVNGEWCLPISCSTLMKESDYLASISNGTVPLIATDQHMAGISKETIDLEKYDSFMKNLDCGRDVYGDRYGEDKNTHAK